MSTGVGPPVGPLGTRDQRHEEDGRWRSKRIERRGLGHHEADRHGWEGQLYVDGTRRKVRPARKVDLLARMNESAHAAATGEAVGDGVLTFAEVAAWRDRVLAPQPAPSTLDRYRWTLDLAVAELGKVGCGR